VSATLQPADDLRLRLSGSTLPAQLSTVRQQVAAWATAAGMGPDDVDDVVLATNEALTNVVDHAYADGDGDAVLEARLRPPDELVVSVRDRGQWRVPPRDPGFRGHGMALITGLAEFVAVHCGETGTAIEMHWHVR
jgi:serine/threonine-protein kinase RsbW